MQPGETISPQSEAPEQPATSVPTPMPVDPAPKPTPEPQESFYKPEEASAFTPQTADTTKQQVPADVALSWEASEYVEHEKSGGWYALLVVGTVVIAAIIYFLTSGDWFATGVVVIASVLFGIVAARKPRTLRYEIDSRGIAIGDKHYTFAEFKTFSLVTDTALHSVQLLPLKRFMPPLNIYFPPTDEDKVVQTLGMYLPFDNRGRDAFDRLMGRIRF